MAAKRERGIAHKSQRRTEFIEGLAATLRSKETFETLDYRQVNETRVKTYMHRQILDYLKQFYEGESDAPEKDAKDSLLWEGDTKTTINNIKFLGVQHRPDFVVQIDDKTVKVAVEVKLGEKGSAIREGIGQGLVYASCTEYHFVVFLFVDTSKDKKIRNSLEDPLHQAFVESLWNHYNVHFEIV